MKKCPYCAEDIQDAAVVCRHCQRDLSPVEVPAVARNDAPPRQGNKGWWLAVAVGFLMSFFGGGILGPGGVGFFTMWIGIALAGNSGAAARWVGGFLLACVFMIPGIVVEYGSASRGALGRDRPTTTTAPAPQAVPPLELLASNGTIGHGYHTVEGQVKNVSSEPLDNVKVVVSWFTKDGTFVKKDDALIDYRPLLPGQTSPFSSMASSNPAMTGFRVEFTTFRGAVLEHVDHSDEKKKRK